MSRWGRNHDGNRMTLHENRRNPVAFKTAPGWWIVWTGETLNPILSRF
jgi:hypothetical protein